MKRIFFLCIFATLLGYLPRPIPTIITQPDYDDSFIVFAAPRHNPRTLGTLTRDGYPVMPRSRGSFTYILQPGERIPGPLYLPGPDSGQRSF